MSVSRIKVDIAGLVGGPGLSTWHADDLAAGYGDAAWALNVKTFWDQIKAVISDDLVFSFDGTIDTIDAASGQIIGTTTVATWSVAGTHADAPLPPTSQGLVSWLTGTYLNGRQVIGKTFIPGPVETVSDAPGVPSAGYVTGLQNAATAYRVAAPYAGVYSRKNGQILGIPASRVWTQWAVLRGRRDG